VLILDGIDKINFKFENLTVIILNTEISWDEFTKNVKSCDHCYRMALGMSDYWTMVGF
jgi:hypothetical protein